MDHNNESSPATTGSHTPTVPVGSGWGQMSPQMLQQMMAMMPGWGGMPPMQQQMMQQMMGMMPVWQPGMQPGVQTGMQPGVQHGMQPGVQHGMQGSPGGDNAYRPSFDFLTASSHTSTPMEERYTAEEMLDLDSMGIDLGDPSTPVPVPVVQAAPKRKKTKGKSKVVGESSQSAVHDTATRRKWKEEEYVAVAKAWLSVCDDPLVANNQKIVNMWAKIRAAYRRYCPEGKDYSPEECRKGWERIRAAVGRFSGLYTNAMRTLGSGQNEEDARREAENKFPVPNVYKEFSFWECYQVLKESEKFRAGCDAGWPTRPRLNYSTDYSGSSGGSHDLPPDAQDFPSPPSFGRRPRPIGRLRAQRAARRGSPLSPHEVISSPPPPPAREFTLFTRQKTEERMYSVFQEWRAATDPEEKGYLKTILDNMRVDLDSTRGIMQGSDAGTDTPTDVEAPGDGGQASGNGGGDDEEDEE